MAEEIEVVARGSTPQYDRPPAQSIRIGPGRPSLYQKMHNKASNYLRMHTLCAIFVSVGNFIFGFDTASIGPITVMPQFEDMFHHISPTLQGLIVSSILIPASITSLIAGPLANRISRIYTVSLGGFIFAIGSILAASSSTLPQLFVGRCIAGAGEGLFLSTITVYTCEIAPASIRGRLGWINQMLISLGLTAGYFVCYGTAKHPGSFAWRFPFGLQAAMSLLIAFGTPFLPHSPRWLRHVGRYADADKAWARLQVNRTEAEKEDLALQREEREAASATASGSIFKEVGMLWEKGIRGRTALGCFVMAMQQASGIDGVLYYAPVLFTQAGLSSSKASFLASGVTGLLILACTIVTQPLVDKWGRRPSTIYGGTAHGLAMILVGVLYASHADSTEAGRWTIIVLIYVFVTAYSLTWAIVNRLYCSEIQPNKTRAVATSLGQCINSAVNWIVAFSTPLFLSRSSFGPYFLFGGFSIMTAIVCLGFQPESQGVSLESLDDVFAHPPWVKMLSKLRAKFESSNITARRGGFLWFCRSDAVGRIPDVTYGQAEREYDMDIRGSEGQDTENIELGVVELNDSENVHIEELDVRK